MTVRYSKACSVPMPDCPRQSISKERWRSVVAREVRSLLASRAPWLAGRGRLMAQADAVAVTERWYGPCEECGQRSGFLALEPGSEPPRKICPDCYDTWRGLQRGGGRAR